MTILSVPSIRLGVSARLGLYSHSTEPCRNYLVPSTKTRLIRCSDGSNRRALTIASMNCHVGHCFSPKALLGAQRYYHALLERPEPWLGYAACNAMTRNYASESNKSVTADEYILELQDL